jgi:hypothetical protein
VRFAGVHVRFAGTLDIERRRGTALVEKHSNHAIWETCSVSMGLREGCSGALVK